MPAFFNQQQVQKITEFALEAGKIAQDFFFKKNFQTRHKKDNSLVTSADLAVSEFLFQKLNNQFPQIPLICEERELRDFAGETFFAIDPIDGTSSFACGNVEFAINIALICNKKPVFGLIYAPLFEGGKMAFSNEKNQVVLRSQIFAGKIFEQIIKLAPSASNVDGAPLNIITSPRTKNLQIESFIAQLYPKFLTNLIVHRLSSAIKFLHLLENKSQLYLHFRPSMEWDTAAGQALVELLGGSVKNLSFKQDKFLIEKDLSYKKQNFINSSFVSSF